MISTQSERKLIADNANEVFRLLSKKFNFTTNAEMLQKIRNHPYYPSFASFDFALQKFGIDSLAIQAEYKHMMYDLPSPFLVHLTPNDGLFLLVDKVDEEYVYFVNEKNNIERESRSDFMKQWSGNVMALEKTELSKINKKISKVTSYASRLKTFLIAATLLVGLLYLVQKFSAVRDAYNYITLMLTGIGVVISSLLLIQKYDKNNPLIKRICNPTDFKNDCHSILNSDAAHLFGVISWSTIGFIFFTFLLLVTLLLPGTVTNMIVFIFSSLAAPFILYSLYYQYSIAKTWCVLCLSIQAVLAGLLAASLFLWQFSFEDFKISMLVPHLILFSILIAIYAFINPFLEKMYNQKAAHLENKYNKLKFNEEVMHLLLDKEPRIDEPSFYRIHQGNPEASNKITVISNPTCGPCIDELKKLFEILEVKKDTYVEHIFLIHPHHKEINSIAINMLHAFETLDEKSFLSRFEKYYQQYPESRKQWHHISFDEKEAEGYLKIIEAQHQWCVENQIKVTPTVYFNQKKLPEYYTIEDLDYLCY